MHKKIVILIIVLQPLMIYAQSFPVEGKVTYTNAVYFDFGKHQLRPESDSVLTELTDIVSEAKNLLIRITAHTDSIGSLRNNMALSQRRSTSLKDALLKMGIPNDKIEIANYGESNPDSTNATASGRQANRRATVEVLKYPPMTKLVGKVVGKKAESEIPVSAMVVLRTKNWQDTLFTDTTGYFEKELPAGIVVGIDAYADCYFFNSIMTKTSLDNQPVKIPLEAIEKGKSLNLNNLYFVGNQPVLLPKSEPELPKILRFMQSNPDMVIEVAGHINLPNAPKVELNTSHYILSLNRAKVVHEYLMENGIATNRISYAGYGNWEMVYPHAVSEKHQALNRRVELKVIEGGCE